MVALGKRLEIAGMGLVRIRGWCCSPAGKTWQLPTFALGLRSPEMALAEPRWVFGDMSSSPFQGLDVL